MSINVANFIRGCCNRVHVVEHESSNAACYLAQDVEERRAKSQPKKDIVFGEVSDKDQAGDKE